MTPAFVFAGLRATPAATKYGFYRVYVFSDSNA